MPDQLHFAEAAAQRKRLVADLAHSAPLALEAARDVAFGDGQPALQPGLGLVVGPRDAERAPSATGDSSVSAASTLACFSMVLLLIDSGRIISSTRAAWAAGARCS